MKDNDPPRKHCRKCGNPRHIGKCVQPERRRGSEWRTQTRTAEDDALGYHLD